MNPLTFTPYERSADCVHHLEKAGEELLPLVYGKLQKLAASMLMREKPGHTLESTCLVHEAYLRMTTDKKIPHWQNQQHFIAAIVKTMRRILVEAARRRSRQKNGGNVRHVDVDLDQVCTHDRSRERQAVDESLRSLFAQEPVAARLIELHYFAGMTLEEAATTLHISVRSAYRYSAFARAWLQRDLEARAM
jgi:RNA polymerase sigma factor (TIGR02999 family)